MRSTSLKPEAQVHQVQYLAGQEFPAHGSMASSHGFKPLSHGFKAPSHVNTAAHTTWNRSNFFQVNSYNEKYSKNTTSPHGKITPLYARKNFSKKISSRIGTSFSGVVRLYFSRINEPNRLEPVSSLGTVIQCDGALKPCDDGSEQCDGGSEQCDEVIEVCV